MDLNSQAVTRFSPGVLAALEYYLTQAPTADYISLQGYDVTELSDSIQQMLGRLSCARQVNFSNNSIRLLPPDLSSAIPNVKWLDISLNKFTSMHDVIQGLLSMPRLEHLKISLPSEEEEKLAGRLKNLITLNGVCLTPPKSIPIEKDAPAGRYEVLDKRDGAQGVVRYESNRPTWSEGIHKLEPWNINRTAQYDLLYQQCCDVTEDTRCHNKTEFEDLKKLIISQLKAKEKNEPNILKQQIHRFNAESLLLEYCNEELVRTLSNTLTNAQIHLNSKNLLLSLLSLHQEYSRLMTNASLVMNAMQEDGDKHIEALRADLLREIERNEHFQKQAEQNDLKRIIIGADGRIDKTGRQSMKMSGKDDVRSNDFVRSPDGLSLLRKIEVPSGTTTPDSGFSKHFAKSVHDVQARNSLLENLGASALPLKDFKRLINQLMKFKRESKSHHEQLRLPKETMEQSLYSFVSKNIESDAKYTPDVLRHDKEGAVRSKVLSVFESVMKYSKSDIDVEVFSLILRHELDENFWHTHEALKHDTLEILKQALHNSRQISNNKNPDDVFSELLDYQQATYILKVLFPGQDVTPTLRVLFCQQIKNMKKKGILGEGFDWSPSRIPTGENFKISGHEILNNILRANLQRHRQAIAPFVEAFRHVDEHDHAGVINDIQLKLVIAACANHLDEIAEKNILERLDPAGHRLCFFNDVIAVLAQPVIPGMWWRGA